MARGLGIDGKTVARYIDLLVDLLLVRRLPPLAANIGKRLVRSPKVYVRDSGILHGLLGLTSREELLGRGFRFAWADLDPSRGFVVCPVEARYPLVDRIEAINVAELCSDLATRIPV